MIISFLAGTIAGLAAAAFGDTLVALAAFAGVFVAVEIRRAPEPTQRAWWQTDIMQQVGAMLLQSRLCRLSIWTAERITGSYPADRRYIEHTTEPPVPQPGNTYLIGDRELHPILSMPHCALCKEWRIPMAYAQREMYLCGSCYYAIDSRFQPAWKPIGFIEYTGETIRLS